MSTDNEPILNFEDIVPRELGDPQTSNYLLLEDSNEKKIYQYPEDARIIICHFPDGEPLKTLIETEPAINQLAEYGIPARPYVPVTFGDKVGIATAKVIGGKLSDILKNKTSPDLIEKVDQLWANLTRYYEVCRQNGNPCIRNISTPDQYTFGTIAGESEPDIWLTHIPQSTHTYSESHDPWYDYQGDILRMTNDILDLENTLGQELSQSREAIEEVLPSLHDERQAQRIREALKKSEHITLTEEDTSNK